MITKRSVMFIQHLWDVFMKNLYLWMFYYVTPSKKDIDVRLAKSWTALNSINKSGYLISTSS